MGYAVLTTDILRIDYIFYVSQVGVEMSTAAGDRHSDPADDEQLRSALPDAANTLLLTPSLETVDDYGCAQLSHVAPPANTAAMWVSFARSFENRLAVWRSHINDEPPAWMGFVDVGRTRRSEKLTASIHGNGHDIAIETVAPTDLTGLGIALTEYASQWNDDARHLTVCFHSLSVLLQYVGLRHAFRFLHNTTGCLRSADATAHFHMDPSVHDERTVNTARMLFDAVVEHDDDRWTVSVR